MPQTIDEYYEQRERERQATERAELFAEIGRLRHLIAYKNGEIEKLVERTQELAKAAEPGELAWLKPHHKS